MTGDTGTPAVSSRIGWPGQPRYPRTDVAPGIVHIGVGGFHRAHQAMYVDRIMRRDPSAPWTIRGIGALPGDRRMRDALASQDYLYTLTLKHPDGTVSTDVIGAITDFLVATDDPDAAIEAMAAASTHIVSLTITEGGYNIAATTGVFDLTEPAVVADLTRNALPRTVFGLVVEALRRRRERGIRPFTIMSCDNIAGNGQMARGVFTAFAYAADPDLAEWIDTRARFPNSMVDRITPATPAGLAEEVRERVGIVDAWPVVAEPFTQWVLEDSFVDGRPPFEDVGVQMVDDVAPYELMKLRLLNAGHQTLCYAGYLLGYRTVVEATRDPVIAALLRAYMRTEGLPSLPPVPGVDLDDYIDTLIQRFSNPAIGDTIERLCADSSDRIPRWLIPVVRERIDAGGSVPVSAAVVAMWTRYAEGIDEQGEPIDVVDRRAGQLVVAARASRRDPAAFIGIGELFGDLADDNRFMAPYTRALDSLRARGTRVTLEDILAQNNFQP